MIEIRWKTASWSLLVRGPWYPVAVLQTLKHFLFYRQPAPKQAISGSGFDIVTVVFKEELVLLRLQARSLARWLDTSFDGNIIVIVNDLDTARTMRKIRRWIVPEYGRWRDRVQIVPFYQLGHGLDPYNGWVVQQALKLAASHSVSRPFYLVLDAKNHAVGALSAGHFVSPEGRGTLRHEDRISMPAHHAACARYFGFDLAAFPTMPAMPGTPFVMHTQTARDLVAFIETKERRSQFSFFCRTRLMSEFLLYGFYLHAVRKDEIGLIHQRGDLPAVTVRPETPESASVRHGIGRAVSGAPLFFSLHLKSLKRLSAADSARLERYWRQRGLLGKTETLQDLRRELHKWF